MAQTRPPSASDDLLFEALLKQGCAADKAARIAHIRDAWGDVDDDEAEDAAHCRRPAVSKNEMLEVLRKG